jgi:hypothetical protein
MCHKSWLIGLALMLVSASARADCCGLVKIDATPASTQVRVCDAATSCATPLFEGVVDVGLSQPLCAAGNVVSYQEYDPATAAYGPLTEARCDVETDVEL